MHGQRDAANWLVLSDKVLKNGQHLRQHPDVDVAIAVTVAFAAYISRKINALQFARFICRRRL